MATLTTQQEPLIGRGLKASILIVDDDPAFGELQRYILSDSGFSAHVASGVRPAIERLGAESFDAIILDYRLPDGSAWAVVEAANSCSPDVPVIMVTRS